jgi:hypothetical protein
MGAPHGEMFDFRLIRCHYEVASIIWVAPSGEIELHTPCYVTGAKARQAAKRRGVENPSNFAVPISLPFEKFSSPLVLDSP